MANKNKTECNCTGIYNPQTDSCDAPQAGGQDPCPSNFWGSTWGWLNDNFLLTYTGGGMGGQTPYTTPVEKKDNTALYVALGVAFVLVIYFATKKKK